MCKLFTNVPSVRVDERERRKAEELQTVFEQVGHFSWPTLFARSLPNDEQVSSCATPPPERRCRAVDERLDALRDGSQVGGPEGTEGVPRHCSP